MSQKIILRELNIVSKALLKGALDHFLQHSPCLPRIHVAYAYLGEYQKMKPVNH